MSSEASPTLVSTIIPTMATIERAPLLKRAIESVRRSSAQPIVIIVVVNGNRCNAELCEWLRAQIDIRLKFIPTPSAPNAVLHGRELVDSKYFSTLDDDDEYLDGGIDLRLTSMCSDGTPDVVVTNGIRRLDTADTPCYRTLDGVSDNPLKSLFENPWLNSGNALYRSASVGPEYFSDYLQYVEWTWLAFKLAMNGKQIATLNNPTVVYYDTLDSLSKSKAYEEAYGILFQRMLDRLPPPEVTKLIQRRMGSNWHDQSIQALCQGKSLKAIRCHLRSLFLPGGGRYLSYSRRLLPGWPKS
ncbi:hypothetical protein GALL_107310 [mine drainage metagenome]|uniref:Glycosyltransferase 2-like domain-containing protein n=1 Tax=mine drainage metagenome TaxID=410659 RepID=A0A1J5T4R5_9ZZZZ